MKETMIIDFLSIIAIAVIGTCFSIIIFSICYICSGMWKNFRSN